MTMTVGAKLLPSPREAAMVQSMNADMANDHHMTETFCIPASTTACSLVNSRRNSRPKTRNRTPATAAAAKE